VSEILRISDFSQGLNTDLPRCELPPGAFTYGNNFRHFSGAIYSHGGSQLIKSLPADVYPKFIYPVDAEADYWVLITDDEVYTFFGNEFYDVTGPVIANGGYGWTGTSVGRIPVFANSNNYPFCWLNPSPATPVVDLVYDALAGSTWRDVQILAKSIRSFGPFLIALNVTDAGENYGDLIQWSHPADVGSIPDSWDYFRDDRLANRVNLGGNGGDIIDGGTLRDSFVVYRENGISLLSATQDEYVFGIRHMSEMVSVANVRCIAEVKGTQFIMTVDDIITNDGNSLTSIIHSRIRKDFAARFLQDNQESAFVLKNEISKELWFCIPSGGSVYVNVAYIFNWRDGTWAIRELPDLAHGAFGSVSPTQRTWDTWLTPAGGNIQWNSSVGIWDQGRTTPFDKSLVGISATKQPNELVNLFLVEVDEPFTTVIERTDIPLAGHDTVTSIQRIYPHIDGPGTDIETQEYDPPAVMISLGSQDYANGPVRWKPAVPFYPRKDRKLDIRTTGELHAFRIESTSTDTWRLSGMDIEYVVAGKR
jgi:hypothetical protein